jgi:tetratricopeptide (TPR) repeat protein
MKTYLGDFSFGALLKAFRTRQHLKQQQLAQAIGVHRRTLVRWEQGDYLPESKAMVLELARCLKLDGQETRQLLEASLTALSPYWFVPLPRNPYFTGREEILKSLHTQLGVDQAVALTQSSALHGLGGVGKTQIALEYAYRHALEYSAVFWIRAETEGQIVASFLRIAEALLLPGRDDTDQQQVIAAVYRWLSTHGQWLLIWDNVEDLALLDRFRPPVRQGAILITTRSQALGTLARGINLSSMEPKEGMLFLLRRAKVLPLEALEWEQLSVRLPGAYEAAVELVTILGGLPLALDQAGAYIEETGCSLTDYVQRYSQQRSSLLNRRGSSSGAHHPQSVTTTFKLAYERVEREQPAALQLLWVCAFLQPEAIPEELFVEGATNLGPDVAELVSHPVQYDQAVAGLRNLSLLQRHPETQTLSIHRLVQAVLLETMTEAERTLWISRCIDALDAVFPEVLPESEHAIWKSCERLLAHALRCLDGTGAAEESLTLASLAYKAAQYLRNCGRYVEAEPLFQRAVHIREQAQGPDHPEVARVLNYLAVLYWHQGKYAEAEPLLQRVLSIREQRLGLDHTDTAGALNNLAVLYGSQGKYAEAEPLLQRVLSIREQRLGLDHTDTATTLNNLALLYREQGKYAQAEALYLRALGVHEQTLGPEHIRVAQVLNNLAEVYRDQGRDREAEPLLWRARSTLEHVLGRNHPDMVQVLNNLADLLHNQHRSSEAEPLYVRTLQISEQSEEPSAYSQQVTSLNGLAHLLRDREAYAEAEALYLRALSTCEQHLGQNHPETAQTLHDLAFLRQRQGRLDEALALAQRAFALRSQVLGETHPKTDVTRALCDQLFQEQIDVLAERTSDPGGEKTRDPRSEEYRGETASLLSSVSIDLAPSQNNPLQAFLDACCELHPRAWCRSADLWQAYQLWSEQSQEPYPLSRRALITQLKAHGFLSDRTKTARIWRGLTLVKKER